jgi:hypothetical protein
MNLAKKSKKKLPGRSFSKCQVTRQKREGRGEVSEKKGRLRNSKQATKAASSPVVHRCNSCARAVMHSHTLSGTAASLPAIFSLSKTCTVSLSSRSTNSEGATLFRCLGPPRRVRGLTGKGLKSSCSASSAACAQRCAGTSRLGPSNGRT